MRMRCTKVFRSNTFMKQRTEAYLIHTLFRTIIPQDEDLLGDLCMRQGLVEESMCDIGVNFSLLDFRTLDFC